MTIIPMMQQRQRSEIRLMLLADLWSPCMWEISYLILSFVCLLMSPSVSLSLSLQTITVNNILIVVNIYLVSVNCDWQNDKLRGGQNHKDKIVTK